MKSGSGLIVGVVVAGLLAAALLLLVIPISIKNGLIDKDETVQEQWKQISTQLQRRADLIPNLVSTVKGYATHEKDVFTEVADARSRLLAAKGPKDTAAASGLLGGALGRLMAISEKYPDLKANTNFIRLQDELAGTENRIAVARTRYNAVVKDYNASIRKFPGSIFAGGMGLEKAEYYEPPDSAAIQVAPKVEF